MANLFQILNQLVTFHLVLLRVKINTRILDTPCI
jgi:hypothetical protein